MYNPMKRVFARSNLSPSSSSIFSEKSKMIDDVQTIHVLCYPAPFSISHPNLRCANKHAKKNTIEVEIDGKVS